VKSDIHGYRGKKRLGVYSSELGCVSELGLRLSILRVACEPLDILELQCF